VIIVEQVSAFSVSFKSEITMWVLIVVSW
jgi:hypothetical protein